jgi:hypothetical protein
MEFEEIVRQAEIHQLTLLKLVDYSHSLSSAEDHWAVKPGGESMVGKLIVSGLV